MLIALRSSSRCELASPQLSELASPLRATHTAPPSIVTSSHLPHYLFQSFSRPQAWHIPIGVRRGGSSSRSGFPEIGHSLHRSGFSFFSESAPLREQYPRQWSTSRWDGATKDAHSFLVSVNASRDHKKNIPALATFPTCSLFSKTHLPKDAAGIFTITTQP